MHWVEQRGLGEPPLRGPGSPRAQEWACPLLVPLDLGLPEGYPHGGGVGSSQLFSTSQRPGGGADLHGNDPAGGSTA